MSVRIEGRTRGALFAVISLACLVGVASAKTDKKDTQARSWVVDASHGTFSEQLRIEVPGFRDLTPSLALTYDSSDRSESVV